MSNVKKHTEVDDILVSVRRFVDANAPETPAQDKLVLTPEFRVTSPDVLLLTAREDARSSDGSAQESEHTSRGVEERRRRNGPAPSDISELTSKIAALERAIARTADQWEPDGTLRDDYSGRTTSRMQWQEEVELDATGAPLGSAGTSQGRKISRSGDADGQGADQEIMREILSDILQSDLQGDFGEIITRSLRKIVRREVQRALAQQTEK